MVTILNYYWMLQGQSVWADRRSKQDLTRNQDDSWWDIWGRKRKLVGQEGEQPWVWLMTNPECTCDYSCIDCWGVLKSGTRCMEHLPNTFHVTKAVVKSLGFIFSMFKSHSLTIHLICWRGSRGCGLLQNFSRFVAVTFISFKKLSCES
jgi:hypothetical protein